MAKPSLPESIPDDPDAAAAVLQIALAEQTVALDGEALRRQVVGSRYPEAALALIARCRYRGLPPPSALDGLITMLFSILSHVPPRGRPPSDKRMAAGADFEREHLLRTGQRPGVTEVAVAIGVERQAVQYWRRQDRYELSIDPDGFIFRTYGLRRK